MVYYRQKYSVFDSKVPYFRVLTMVLMYANIIGGIRQPVLVQRSTSANKTVEEAWRNVCAPRVNFKNCLQDGEIFARFGAKNAKK